MKKMYFILAVFSVLNGNAQNYVITFAGTGAATTVSTVKVENLMSGETFTLNGSDVLNLKGNGGTTGIIDTRLSSGIKIFPNPMIDNATVEIYPPVSGNATISIFDMSGNKITQIQSYLENNTQKFNLSGIDKGFYLVNVRGNNYQLSGKLISNGYGGIARIEKGSNDFQAVDKEVSKMNFKGIASAVEMLYSTGDRLKFTGISGKYSRVTTGIIEQDKIITFDFIPCTDGDNNNYPVVKIGTQTWIGENLKTTKFNDSINIPLVTDVKAWGQLKTPGYCWYDNDETTYKDTFGALYNWYAAGSGKLCPTGWHVPSDVEWTTLTTYLGGQTVAGGKLKETGTAHWGTPNTGATNETGFTALPGSDRTGGYFDGIGNRGFWWSSTEYDTYVARFRQMDYNTNFLVSYYFSKYLGFSVRCVKD